MMSRAILFSFCLFLFACNSKMPPTNQAKNSAESQKVGGDRDEHGCLPAAGQTWSQIKQSCVRVFQVGDRLNPLQVPEGQAEMSAFVIFNDDQSQVELFVPGTENQSILLNRTGDGIYEKDSYRFDAKSSSLSIDGQEAYKGSK